MVFALYCVIDNSFGKGTSSDPYLIYTPADVDRLRNFTGRSDVYFKLMADIDMADYIAEHYPTEGWKPIGSKTSNILTGAFSGILDGDNHTISNLWMERSSECLGFFAVIGRHSTWNFRHST